MTSVSSLVASTNGTALWYLTRASGVVGLILLTGTLVIGIVASIGWTRERWPRFLSQEVHRNLSLLCLGFVAVHVVTTVGDGYVPISLADAFVPFRSPYRPVWVGLGAVTLDLLIAVLITSALRRRVGYRSWRFVHWLAYACWPIALLHGLGTGSDASLGPVLAVDGICTVVVVAAVAWRLVTGRSFGVGPRLAAGALTLLVVLAIAVTAALGPLRPGWSHRSGTSSALLAEIAAKATGTPGPTPTVPTTAVGSSTTGGTGSPSGQVPVAPFSYPARGAQTTVPLGSGMVRITLSFHLDDADSTLLLITLEGEAVSGGGISLDRGGVRFGPYEGTVTSLDGNRVAATIADDGPLALQVTLAVDEGTGALSGVVTGTTVGGP